MSDHPSTLRGDPATSGGIEWTDGASVHWRGDGESGGVFDAFKALHRGTLAEMVALVSTMPADKRGDYVIQKAGDRRLEIGEIMALAARSDFPGG